MQELSKYSELGRPLTAAEVDGNWDAISAAVAGLENGNVPVVGINLVENESGAFLNFIDGEGASVALIPFPAGLQQAGVWISGASYTTRDIVTFEGGTYLCAIAHTAGASIAADLDLGRWLQLGSSGGGSGGTAEDVTYDNATSGLTAATVQAALDEIVAYVEGIEGGEQTAATVPFTPASGITATNVQAAIVEVKGLIGAGTDDQTAAEVPFTPVSGTTATNVQAALSDAFSAIADLEFSGGGGSDDQTASEVPFTPSGGISATNVQAAIVEVKGMIPAGGGSDDQTAAQVPYTPQFGMLSTNVQDAIGELKGYIGEAGDPPGAWLIPVEDFEWTTLVGTNVQWALGTADQELTSIKSALTSILARLEALESA